MTDMNIEHDYTISHPIALTCVIELRKTDNTKTPPETHSVCINPGSVTYDGVRPNEAAVLFFKEIQLDLAKFQKIVCPVPEDPKN